MSETNKVDKITLEVLENKLDIECAKTQLHVEKCEHCQKRTVDNTKKHATE